MEAVEWVLHVHPSSVARDLLPPRMGRSHRTPSGGGGIVISNTIWLGTVAIIAPAVALAAGVVIGALVTRMGFGLDKKHK